MVIPKLVMADPGHRCCTIVNRASKLAISLPSPLKLMALNTLVRGVPQKDILQNRGHIRNFKQS